MPSLQSLIARGVDVPEYLSARGLVWQASDGDQNDTVTGQTSFVATTPTLMIDVIAGFTVIPLLVSLVQTGTVAGAAVSVIIEKDDADRYDTGGTNETLYNDQGRTVATGIDLYSGATALAGSGTNLLRQTVGQDVSPAEGAVQEVLWTPNRTLDYIQGPGGFLVYTYAGTTEPTWFWTIKFAVVPTDWVG